MKSETILKETFNEGCVYVTKETRNGKPDNWLKVRFDSVCVDYTPCSTDSFRIEYAAAMNLFDVLDEIRVSDSV